METKITDAKKITDLLVEYLSIKIDAVERGSDAEFSVIVKAMKNAEFNNFDLANLNIDLAAIEALAKKHGCYDLLFPKYFLDGLPDDYCARQQASFG